MQLPRILLLFLLIFPAVGISGSKSPTQADDCPTRDLYKTPNSPLLKIPIEDQNQTGICYAVAATTALNHQIIKSGYSAEPPINSVYAAYLYHSSKLTRNEISESGGAASRNVDGGHANRISEEIKTNGVCLNSEIERRLKGLRDAGEFKSDSELLQFLNEAFIAQTVSGYAIEIPACKPFQALDWLRSQKLQNLTQVEVLDKLFAGCTKVKIEVKSGVFSSSDFKGAMNDALAAGDPTVVTMNCFNEFDKGKLRKRTRREFAEAHSDSGTFKVVTSAPTDCDSDGPQLHELIVAGQRKIAGVCNILIRNSWGSTWRSPNATACSCVTNKDLYKDDCTKEEAKTFLGCWFKRKAAIGYMTDAQWMMNDL